MKDAIFLSASVPDSLRSPNFAATADSVAIAAAVAALIHVTLGRRPLIWGGHPAITPMVVVAAENLDVKYGDWVTLYQSRFFEEEFPEENLKFKNVINVLAQDNFEKSLLSMREKMFDQNSFSAAVFIGGMEGVVEEYDLFKRSNPTAKIIPVSSTGGAAKLIADKIKKNDKELLLDLDYISLLHKQLGISTKEKRYRTRSLQPKKIDDRMWRRADPRPGS